MRDYRIQSSAENAIVAGGSAFNVRAESLRLGDFSPQEVESLLAQHIRETGQALTNEARAAIWELTRGQPWLVNALAYESCFKNRMGRDRSQAITEDAIQDAREQLILRRETHLDQLADKLREERVRRVIEPLLSGAESAGAIAPDDLEYVRDLGLVTRNGPVAVANPIYREVIPRDLTYTTQEMSIHHDPAWYVGGDGTLRVGELLAAFQAFFREHSEHWVERFQYREAGPQLLLQAFLQRIVNSGGRIEREYGLGRMRTDPPARLAAGRSHRADTDRETQRAAEGGDRVQGASPGARTDPARRSPTDAGIHGSQQGGGRTPGGLRPHRGQVVEGEEFYRRDEVEGGAPVTVWGM